VGTTTAIITTATTSKEGIFKPDLWRAKKEEECCCTGATLDEEQRRERERENEEGSNVIGWCGGTRVGR
jgi:hypothetical protein